MQSFVSVQPGQTVSCIGCHEPRNRSTLPPGYLDALQRPPSKPVPVADVPGVFDFPRDIQPILDASCATCHGYDLYYLNVMAGPKRTWKFHNAREHEWLMKA